MKALGFRKSSFSQVGDCVQWAYRRGRVVVGDSKDPNGLVLETTLGDWRCFVASVHQGAPAVGQLTWRRDDVGVSVFVADQPRRCLWFTPAEWDAFVRGIAAGEPFVRSAGA
jgi:hypothetical protein